MSRLADISVAIQEWAYAALTSSQELADAFTIPLNELGSRVWDSPPSADSALPYIFLQVVEPRDVNTVPLVEVMAIAQLQAKVVGQAESYEAIRDHAVALHHALQGKVNVPLAGDGLMMSSRRLRVISYPEQADGLEYRHLGGTYEVIAQ